MSLSTKAKQAIKIALAMSLAYGIALQLGWDNPMWAGFAVAFVSLATVGQSMNKAALRMLGTLIAVGVALLPAGFGKADHQSIPVSGC
ncbi:MAG: FUSC family protein [Gammaproteobacteria bacterium]